MANLYCCRVEREMCGDFIGLRITGESEEAQMLKEAIHELVYICPPEDIVSCDRAQFRSVLLATALLYHNPCVCIVELKYLSSVEVTYVLMHKLFLDSARVVKNIEALLEREGSQIFGDKYVSVQINDQRETEVIVYAIRSRAKPRAGKDVLSKISFWIEQQGLDKFVQVFPTFLGIVNLFCDSLISHSMQNRAFRGTREFSVVVFKRVNIKIVC